MAFLQCSFFSPTLCFGTDINVFIPTPNSDEILNNKKSSYYHEGSKFQVLYLLHGAYGDYMDWMRLTSIEKYAQEHKLAVIMPSASNSFYQNMYLGSAYLTYLTQELPTFAQKMFPISHLRENTFTAGLSMGGYGALKLAFECPEKYSACASLSGAVDAVDVVNRINNGEINGPFKFSSIFKDSTKIAGSEIDIFHLIKKGQSEGKPLPKVFQSCGTEDFIYESNVQARKKLEALGIDLTYEEHTGIHDWDTHIQRVLDWLPLENNCVYE